MLYAHENAHLIQSDKDEEIAKYAETKIGENKNKFTENEKEEYLSNLRKNVSIDKTLEEQFEIARSIPESERENKGYGIIHTKQILTPAGGVVGGGATALTIDDKTKEAYISGLLLLGGGFSYKISNDKATALVYYPFANTPEDLTGFTFGGAFSLGSINLGGSYDPLNGTLSSIELGTNGNAFKNFSLKELRNINVQGTGIMSINVGSLKVSSKEIENILKISEKEKEIEQIMKAEKNISKKILLKTEILNLNLEKKKEIENLIKKYDTIKEKTILNPLWQHKNEPMFWGDEQ